MFCYVEIYRRAARALGVFVSENVSEALAVPRFGRTYTVLGTNVPVRRSRVGENAHTIWGQ